MTKRILSIIICIIMAMSTVTFVHAQEDIVDGALFEKTGTTNLAGEPNTNLVEYSNGIARTWAMDVSQGSYFEYKINTETALDYWLSFRIGSPLNNAYVNVYVNDKLVGDNVLLPTTTGYDALVDVNFGIVSLNVGENIVRFERKANGTSITGQENVASVRRIILEAFVENITADSMTYDVNSTTYDGGSNIIESTDKISVKKGGYVEYNIATAMEDTYRLQIGISNDEAEDVTGNIYFNGNKIGEDVSFAKTGANTEKKYDFGIVKIEKGINTIKIERNNDGTASTDDNNVIDVKHIYVEKIDEDIISASVEFPLNNTTTTTGGFWNPNAKNLSLWKNGWFEYTVNTLSEGTYYLALAIGSVRDDATASAYVNGECVLKDFKIPNTGNKNKPETVSMGLVTLKAGANTIKMVRNANAAVDDTACVHSFTLDREDIASNTVEFVLNSTTVKSHGTVSANSYDIALWQNGWFEYNINTQKEGMFNIYLGAGTTLEESSVDVYVNNTLAIDNASIQCTSADTSVFSNKLGSVNLIKGKNTIKIMRTTEGLASGYISARKLTLALPIDSYVVTSPLGIYDSTNYEKLWIAKEGESAYAGIEVKKYGSVADKFYVILANYTADNKLTEVKLSLVDLSKMSDGETKAFSTEATNMSDTTVCLKAFMIAYDNIAPLTSEIAIYNPNLVEKNENVIVNIAADGFETNVLKKSPNASGEVYLENVRNYVLRYLNNTPTGRLSFNICYKRSVVDSDVFDSVLYNVELDENGNAVKDADGNSIKTKIEQSTSSAMLSWYRDVIEREIDIVEMAVTATKECGAEAWLSLRMNDNHYNEDPNFNSTLSYERAEELGVNGKRVNLDFTKEPVQNYYLAYIKELCQNYDIDGIELDFLRAGPYMTTVNDANIAELSDFVNEIRTAVNEIAAQKNKKIGVAARVYADEAENLNYGMDAAQWIADGSIDVLATGAYYIPTYYKIPLKQWRNSIDAKNTNKNQYALLASADWAVRCDMTAKSGYMMWITLEQLKGFASSSYQNGADGIYLFNHFSTSDSGSTTYYVDENGNMTKKEILADKLKALDSIDSAENGLRVYVDTDKYTDRSRVYPKSLTNSSLTVKLNTGRSLKTGYYTVVVGIDSLEGYTENNFSVTVNGKSTTQLGDVPTKTGFTWKVSSETQPVARHVSETAPRVMQFKVDDLSAIADGENTIVITNNSGNTQTVKWVEVHVDSTPSASPVEKAQ